MMETKTLKIPKNVKIDTNVGDFVSRKIMKVKMGDMTTAHDFELNVKGRDVTVYHPNKKSLNLFAKRLNLLIKDSGNKLDKIIG